MVAKWRNRSCTADVRPGPKDAHSTVLSIEEEAIIVAFRKHTLLPLDDCLYALQASIPHLTRSSLHRCLQRHDISRLPEVEGDKPKRGKFSSNPIGYFHIDMAEVRTEQGKLYMFVAIDRTSKFAFVELHENSRTATSRDFLLRLIEAVPYKIHTVLTDNGIQFTTPGGGGIGRPTDQGSHRQRRTLLGARLRVRLRQEQYRSSNHQAQAPMDQRPGRADEPNDQGSDRKALLLRDARSTARAPRQLRRGLQLRQAAQDTQGPHDLRIHLQMLDKRAPAVTSNPHHQTPEPNI